MVLPDHVIRYLCKQHAMVVPYIEENLNPASFDLTLGDRIMVEVPGEAELQIVGIQDRTVADPFWLTPGAFVLAETREIFNLPDNVAGKFALKSSRAREGYSHMLAGYADPGWHGSRLTLELQNARQHAPLPLYPGLRIGQMIFYKLESLPDRSYAVTGRYNKDETVTASKG